MSADEHVSRRLEDDEQWLLDCGQGDQPDQMTRDLFLSEIGQQVRQKIESWKFEPQPLRRSAGLAWCKCDRVV